MFWSVSLRTCDIYFLTNEIKGALLAQMMRVLLNVNNMPLPKRYTICLTSGNGKSKGKHVSVADAFATDAIIGLATVFHQRNIPDLKPTTDYQLLSSLKQSCDTYADQVINAATDDELDHLELE